MSLGRKTADVVARLAAVGRVPADAAPPIHPVCVLAVRVPRHLVGDRGVFEHCECAWVTAQGDVTSEGKSWQMRTFFEGHDRRRIPRTEVTVE